MPDVHIIPNGDQWNARVENGDVVATCSTQAEAERTAKEWARANGGGEVFVHRVVVSVAQQHQVLEGRRAALRVPDDVVDLSAARRAARKAAVDVAPPDG